MKNESRKREGFMEILWKPMLRNSKAGVVYKFFKPYLSGTPATGKNRHGRRTEVARERHAWAAFKLMRFRNMLYKNAEAKRFAGYARSEKVHQKALIRNGLVKA